MLLRLDDLQRRVTRTSGVRPRSIGERPLSQSRIERNGVPVGTLAPSFRLPTVDGGELAIDAYQGRRSLLVFSDPDCGPCAELGPRLAALHHARVEGCTGALMMIGRGDLEENRRKAAEHGIEFPVAVQRRWEISRAYGIFATPVAFVIGPDGRTEGPVIRGVNDVLEAAREVLDTTCEEAAPWPAGSTT